LASTFRPISLRSQCQAFQLNRQEIDMLHEDNIFKSMKDIKFEETVSHQCGVTMNDSVEARAIADVMSRHDHITVTYMPAMIRIDGIGKMEFKMDEISEELGRVMTPYLFEISTSTHYGRMVMTDDNTVVLFGDMNEAMKYIS
jgi:propane monooxygenase coupling protein